MAKEDTILLIMRILLEIIKLLNIGENADEEIKKTRQQIKDEIAKWN